MEIIGRVTADAKANTLKDGRTVVNFTVAINDSYKAKGVETPVKVTQFVNCGYWINPGIVPHLTKGTLVELYGRIGVNAWTNTEGEAKAGLTFHVNSIKLHGGKYSNPTPKEAAQPEATKEDLPF
ncbi:single-stranded DNA-binding protein [Terrimonas sp.]|uniref:single-stranded DNA-binding protein n=1 Tax=Terrimonas sp. TaxID=1914338 RepID=UPI000D50D18F|nr:single-stranded DNA-binding protein [Terrimonas sp.]PVD52185.1 single-stranded DNA-binding protein [Terrimonas sp.]